MSGSAKLDGATGIITVALAGISASFSAQDFHEWGAILMSNAPFLLILFLIWRIYRLDKQHADCLSNHAKMQEQVLLAYMAIKNPHTRAELPHQEDFLAGKFNIGDIVERRKT